ncbi:4-hydroxyphenylpyruvate dioxygenase [Streptomyces pluripotens]|uniref:4-hydroxyphenylpyruvate dioxygenase n=2 Tax=Streptomyces TaxID=1883 RepID=A0A221NTJ8_9ACTN|nr:4-hydroxyphenylpyruvate dioxygenase [Streptomyces pluripotens]ASN23297.1 4-hydroxyphenylpyruvate dioxygenase [Streptomyces pluripotens]MCH0561248.1 4-hydroxyphenylpyruvate dioxygenase [Streptomyces sp. MUM 16J]
MEIDYVEFYVEDVERILAWLVEGYGFAVRAKSAPAGGATQSVNVGQGGIDLLLTESSEDHPARDYAERHGDGVGDIGIRVPDAAGAFAEAVWRGVRPVTAPVTQGAVTTATIAGFGDVTHTFVQRPDDSTVADVRGLVAVPGRGPVPGSGLLKVDHFAACVEPGRLDETVEYYRRTLDFDLTLTERIVTGDQGMVIKAVQSKSRAVTFTLIEADTRMAIGQIDRFLKEHDGPGVQHLAFSTADILTTVRRLADQGIELLTTPAAYYSALADRVPQHRHPVDELRDLNVLVDEDHDGQLYQIFAKSVHPRNTIFLEIIERVGATSFGSSNIRHLYDSVKAEQEARD